MSKVNAGTNLDLSRRTFLKATGALGATTFILEESQVGFLRKNGGLAALALSLIHISEPTRPY